MNSGIYEIKNVVNGKRYIGSAVNFKKRWRKHAFDLSRDKHHSRHLQNAWNKHGASAFRFRLIRSIPPCYLIAFEQQYIDRTKPEYNISQTAGSALGVKRTLLTRARISASQVGRVISPEARVKMSAAKKGKPLSAEHKAKISQANKSLTFSPEHRAKLSASQMGNKKACGHKNSLGYKHSPETRAKLSASLIGNKYAAGNKNSCRTPEQRANMSAAAKLREAAKRQQK